MTVKKITYKKIFIFIDLYCLCINEYKIHIKCVPNS